MSDPRNHPAVIRAVRTLTIITIGLAVGVLVTLGVLLSLSSQRIAAQAEPDGTPILSMVAAGYTLLAIALGVILASRFDDLFRRKIPADLPDVEMEAGLVRGLTTKRILFLGIFEGAAMFDVIAFYLEHRVFTLAACGILLLLMTLQVPSRDRVATWIEQQKRMVQQSA